MFDYRVRLVPCRYYDTDYLEAWLEDMAQKGLQLSYLGLHLATFQKAPPEKVRYCVDLLPSKNEKLATERLLQLRTSGWDYVTARKRARIYKTADRGLEELPPRLTDWKEELPPSEHQALLPCVALFFLLSLVQSVYRNFFMDGSSMILLDARSFVLLFGTLIWFTLFLRCLVAFLLDQRYRKRQALAAELRPPAYASKGRLSAALLQSVAPLSFVLGFAALFCGFASSTSSVKPVAERDFSFPLLAEINQEEARSIEENHSPDSTYGPWRAESVYWRSPSLLSPAALFVNQDGPLEGEIEENGSGLGALSSMHYHVRYYPTWSATLARNCLMELQQQDQSDEPKMQFYPLEQPEGVELYYGVTEPHESAIAYYTKTGERTERAYTTKRTQNLYLRVGSDLLVIDYSGQTDLRGLVPLFAESLGK